MSYNSEGIMKQEDIVEILSKYGSVALEQFQYTRFKSNNNGLSKTKKHVFERLYLNRYYPRFRAVRTVVLYGSEKEEIAEIQVGFLLNAHGKLVLGIKAPKLFKRAINNLLSYWSDGSDEAGA